MSNVTIEPDKRKKAVTLEQALNPHIEVIADLREELRVSNIKAINLEFAIKLHKASVLSAHMSSNPYPASAADDQLWGRLDAFTEGT